MTAEADIQNTGASRDADGWHPVYDFWFPAELANIDFEGYRGVSNWWFGGEKSAELQRFAPLVDAAAAGVLNSWCATPRGRLSMVLVLDQFPRELWAGTPRAFAYDQQALELAEEGLRNGQYDALDHAWEKLFFTFPLVHAEGSDHLERMDRAILLAQARLDGGPAHLRPMREAGLSRAYLSRDVIARFGRHPHRNVVLGRDSTPAEAAYVESGVFPHSPNAVPPVKPQ